MNGLMLGIAVVLTILLVVGWLLLLILPLVVLGSAATGGLVRGMAQLRRVLPGFTADATPGILGIHGLAEEPSRAARLRSDVARVLKLAPPGTRPRACACVKGVDGAFVGVLRVFNTQGHYLYRASRGSVAAVAERLSSALGEYQDTFPAKIGARRLRCPECDPRSCPLIELKRQRVRERSAA